MRRIAAGALSLSLFAASPAAGQGKECLADLKMPDVGQWAEYQGTMSKKPYTLRYSVVGAEEREGVKMKWMELKMTGESKDKSSVYQVLTPGTPAEMDQAQEIIFKPGDKPAMKMNAIMMMKMLRGQLSKNSVLGNLCEGVSPAGEESVTVPAGTFKALRLHDAKHNSDTWVVPSRPFIMVKAQGKDFELSLASSGDGAKSSITETPKDFGASK